MMASFYLQVSCHGPPLKLFFKRRFAKAFYDGQFLYLGIMPCSPLPAAVSWSLAVATSGEVDSFILLLLLSSLRKVWGLILGRASIDLMSTQEFPKEHQQQFACLYFQVRFTTFLILFTTGNTGGSVLFSSRRTTSRFWNLYIFFTRGWESHWYRLEGGQGGGRAGHGAAVVGHEVPLFQTFQHVLLLVHTSYVFFFLRVIVFWLCPGLPGGRADGWGQGCAKHCENGLLLNVIILLQ